MQTELVPYTVDDQRFDAFVARPDGPAPRPAVLVVHAWGGRDAFAEAKARALADSGCVGVAVDLYGVGVRGHDRDSNRQLMEALTSSPTTLHRRLEASVEVVQGLPGVRRDRVAAIGFCFGGQCVLTMARMGLPLRGVVSFHGLLKIASRFDATPAARMLLLHGQDDPMAPPADVAAFAEEMKRVNGDWELHAYPRVVHAFTNPAANDPDFGTVYDAEADARSWRAMQRFLQDVLAD